MIAIKDFKMPENCLKCPMQFGGWCYVSPPEVDERVAPTVDEAWEQGKPDWCPLVDVPDEMGNCSEVPNNSDCISKRAAIDAAIEELDSGTFFDIPSKLESLPSVQPERKKGEWIHVGFMTEECSECHKQYHELEYGKFCPNCGADLRGEQDEG